MTSLKYVLSVITLLIGPLATAQTPAPQYSGGSKAVLFTFSGLGSLNLNSYEGGIGGKYFISNSMALRGSLQYAAAGRTIPAVPPPGQAGTDGSVSTTNIGSTAAVEFHLSSGDISPYAGAGLGMMFTTTESKDPVFGNTGQTTVTNNRNGETVDGVVSLGGTKLMLFGMAGVEYFLNRSVSLAAEYRFGFFRTARYDEEQISGNTTVTTKLGSSYTFGLTTGGALTASVYF